MSRTFRRKNQHTENDNLYDHIFSQSRHGGVFLQRVRLVRGTKEYALAFWAYHRDNDPGVYNEPKWFRAMLNRRVRRKDEQCLVRTLNRGHLDVVDVPRVKDAGYIWF